MSIHSRMINKTNDGFKTVYKGLGGQRDITTNTSYSRNPYISQNYQMCNGLYSNALAGKAVDIPVEDAFRGGREFVCEEQDKLNLYEQYLDYLKINEKIEMGMKWGKVFGSAVLIIISDDDEMSEPLILDNVKKGDIKDVIVLDRWQLYAMDVNRNPLSSNFLEASEYYVTRSSTPIHHTRVIKLDGLNTTLYDKEVMNGWGLSIYERLYKDLMNAQMSPDLLINLLIQSNLDVVHLKNFNETLVNNNDELALKRLQYAMQGKSIFNGLALDADDQYTNIAKSFSGLDSVHDKFIDLLSAAAEIPKTRYMGEQTTGLSNEGGGDMKIYYDRIEAKERNQLRTVYNYLDPLLTKSLFGETLEFDYHFKSLFQMTPEQESIIRNRDAQTNEINLRNNIVAELEAKQTLINDKHYTSITAESIEKEREEMESFNNLPNEDYGVE